MTAPPTIIPETVVKNGAFSTVLVLLGLFCISVQPAGAAAATNNNGLKIPNNSEFLPTQESYQALMVDGGNGGTTEGVFQAAVSKSAFPRLVLIAYQV